MKPLLLLCLALTAVAVLSGPAPAIEPDTETQTETQTETPVLQAVSGVTPEAAEILGRVDDNLFSDSQWMRSRMVVINRRGRKREMELESHVVGDQKAFSEYLTPVRDKGTKMLKNGKNLWTYTPQSDRIIHIAGHLLRQSVMGSDLSYEDSMEETRLSESYVARVQGRQTFMDRQVWVLILTARQEGLAYPSRKILVDCERFVPLREERMGKSGKLLKTMTVNRVENVEGRWFPMECLYKDELKDGKGTLFIVDQIKFNPSIPENLFTRESLRR